MGKTDFRSIWQNTKSAFILAPMPTDKPALPESSIEKIAEPSDEFKASPKQFFKVAQKHFFDLLSGGIMQGLITLILGITLLQMPPYIFLVVVGIYIIIACYRAWREERNAKNTLNQKLKEKEQYILEQKQTIAEIKAEKADLKADKERIISEKTEIISELRQTLQNEKIKDTPDLIGQLNQIGVGEARHKDGTYTAIICIVNVSNKGAPSVATHWRLVWLIPGYKPLNIFPTHYPGSTSLESFKGKGLMLLPEDAIYNKTSNKPVTKGERVEGYLLFEIPIKRQKDLLGTAIKILFNDFLGKEYAIERVFLTDDFHGELTYVPGMKAKPILPDEE